MPDLPPVEEQFVADTSRYVGPLEAAAEVTQRLADAAEAALAALQAMDEAMNRMAAGAAEAAAAEAKLAEEETAAAAAGAAQAASAGQAAAADRGLAAAAAAAAAAQNAAAEAAGKQAAGNAAAAATGNAAAAANKEVAISAIDEMAGYRMVTAAMGDAAKAAGAVIFANQALAFSEKAAADAANMTAEALRHQAVAQGAAAIAATIAAASITRGVGPLGTMVHWIIAGGSELAAVLIPALIALGAGMAVAAQGAQNVYTHMSALYTATEATANQFHTTIGSALGLGSALQRMQNFANPVVYSILGGAVLALHGSFSGLASVGLQVLRVFQDFSAHLVADFQTGGVGGTLHALLAGMVTDLTEFGQILGNVGHALLGFAAAMPGLAHVLLAVATGISQVILWVSQLPAWMITTVMVFEEAWRWGGLLASIVLRLAQAFGILGTLGLPMVAAIFTQLGTIVQSVALGFGLFFENLGKVIAAIPIFAAETDAAGAAVSGFGAGIFDAVAGISAWQLGLALVATAGIGFLIDKMLTAKTAIQSMTDAMQSQVDHARGLQVFGDIAGNFAKLNTQIAQTGDLMRTTTSGPLNSMGSGLRGTAASTGALTTKMSELHQGFQQQERDMLNAAQAAQYVSHVFGVGFVSALMVGQQAGIQWDAGVGKMSATAAENLIKIDQLKRGYELMGQSAGAVGKDMTVIGIESALQATKIGQLTQEWQTWMGQITGGTSTLATFEQGLHNIGSVASSTAGTLFQATGKMSASTQQFAQSLQGFTGKSAQNWQNFDQVVQTGAQNFITWMQTAGAMGVVTGGQMSGAIKGIVNQLLPFASHSLAARTALAQLDAQTGQTVAPTMSALEAFNKGGDSARQLARFVQDATARMGNMAQVAQNLGAVMQNDLVDMVAKAKLAPLTSQLGTLSTAMHTAGTPASVLRSDILGVVGTMTQLHVSIPTITGLLNTLGVHASQAGVQALIMGSHLQDAGNKALTLGGHMTTLKNNIDNAASSIGKHASAVASDTGKIADNVGKLSDQAAAASRAEEAVKTSSMASATAATQTGVLSGKIDTLNSAISGAAGKIQTAGTQIRTSGQNAQTAAGQVSNYHTQIDNAAGAAQSAAGKMGTLAGQMATAGNQAVTAAGEVHALASAIAGLQSKTITITTVMATVHRAAGGPVFPGVPTMVGEAGPELYMPAVPGYVFSHAQTQAMGGASSGAQGGGGAGPEAIHFEGTLHVPVMLDGQEIANITQPYALRFEKRNGYQWSQRTA